MLYGWLISQLANTTSLCRMTFIKKIQILGTGCPKCKKLVELTDQAANELGIDYKIEKVEDIKEIMKFNVLMTPGLVIDGQVKTVGRVPSSEDIKKLLMK